MKRHVGGLISFSLLTLITGGCQPDAPIGLPVLAGRVEPKPPNVLRDAIAFFTREFSASGGVAIMQPDGSGRQPLPGAEAGFEPAISPNGRRIAFSRNTDIGVTAIYIMDVDAGVARPIVGGLTLNPTPVWSPDGCQIAFRSVLETSGGPIGRISIINADGTGLRQVTPEPGPLDFAFDEGPTWSPDGTRLAFTRNSVLHVINVDGTGMTALPNEDLAGTPSWSPDGERIAYFSLDPTGDIHVRNADGSNLVALTTNPEFESWPRWSADGSQLVISRVIGEQVAVVRINADGTGDASLTPAGIDDFTPDWSRRPRSQRGGLPASQCTGAQ